MPACHAGGRGFESLLRRICLDSSVGRAEDNPRGAEAALKVIRDFPGRRMIITPGMVELGHGEAEFNQAFGTKMAECVDVAILVGKKHTAPIAKGLQEAGFPTKNIHVVATLEEAAAIMRQIGRPGDVALFENDLPDNYSEA